MDMHDYFEKAERQVAFAYDSYSSANYLDACRGLGNAMEAMQEVAADLVQLAHNAGATKKSIALALGIPASTLRGLTRTNVKPKANDGPEGLKRMFEGL